MTTISETILLHVRDLAGRDEWRAVVAALGLGEPEARELRVEIVRRRAFGSGRRLRGRP